MSESNHQLVGTLRIAIGAREEWWLPALVANRLFRGGDGPSVRFHRKRSGAPHRKFACRNAYLYAAIYNARIHRIVALASPVSRRPGTSLAAWCCFGNMCVGSITGGMALPLVPKNAAGLCDRAPNDRFCVRRWPITATAFKLAILAIPLG